MFSCLLELIDCYIFYSCTQYLLINPYIQQPQRSLFMDNWCDIDTTWYFYVLPFVSGKPVLRTICRHHPPGRYVCIKFYTDGPEFMAQGTIRGGGMCTQAQRARATFDCICVAPVMRMKSLHRGPFSLCSLASQTEHYIGDIIHNKMRYTEQKEFAGLQKSCKNSRKWLLSWYSRRWNVKKYTGFFCSLHTPVEKIWFFFCMSVTDKY